MGRGIEGDMSKNKYFCEECSSNCKTKKEFIECLKDHINDASVTLDYCVEELEEMGIENPYE